MQRAQLEGWAKEIDFKKVVAEYDKQLLSDEGKRTEEIKKQRDEQARHAVDIAKRLTKPESAGTLAGRIDANPFDRKRFIDEAKKEVDKFYADERASLTDQQDELAKKSFDYNTLIERSEQEHQDRLLSIERAGAQGKQKIFELVAQGAENAFSALADVQDKSSREGFERYKKFAIAQAIIATILAAEKAFVSLADIPYIGIALGAAAAAAAAAGGYAQVQQIRNQQFTGRRFGGAVNAGGMYEVNEGGDPELLKLGGRTLMLMGKQDGNVIPAKMAASAGGFGGGGFKIVTNLYGAAPGATVQASPMADGVRLDIMVNAIEARLANNTSMGKGPLVKSLETTYPGLQRGGV